MKVKSSTFKLHGFEEHSVRARAVAQVFSIKVFLPVRRTNGSERFPVLYLTDADDNFGACASLANALQLTGESPRFIVVGIGYENPAAAELLRMRDLLPRDIRSLYQPAIEKLASSDLTDVEDLTTITGSTDAREFLHFISSELMPFINGRYPTLPDDNSYFGYSAGGSFGFYTLFSQPDLFRRYILGSPALTYNGHHFGLEWAAAFLESRRKLQARIFMSVGELEELHDQLGAHELVTGYYKMAKFLRRAKLSGLDLTLRVFPDETHATAWPLAFTHGVRTLMGGVHRTPFWEEGSN